MVEHLDLRPDTLSTYRVFGYGSLIFKVKRFINLDWYNKAYFMRF